MSLDVHRAAQALSQQASLARLAGDVAEARALYAEAAELEESALSAVPSDQIRTKGILGVSAVALCYKAARYDEAEALAHRLMADPHLPAFARDELKELLIEVWNEQTLDVSADTAIGSTVEVSLRGSAVGVGEAPLELAWRKFGDVERLLYRVIEWVGRFEFRVTGPPPSKVRESCRVLVSQPVAGSYRFQVRLASARQQPLPEPFREPAVDPDQVAESFINILRSITAAPSRLEEVVPEPHYRDAFLKLARNMAPDGEQIREVEFRRVGTQPEQTLVLADGVRSGITAALPKPARAEEQLEKRIGILRALHLDKKWLEILLTDAAPLRCNIESLLLDDVVGPMVNQVVTVTGYRRRRRGQTQFVLSDIELGDQGELLEEWPSGGQKLATPPLFPA